MNLEHVSLPNNGDRHGDPFYTELLMSINHIPGLSVVERNELKSVIDRYGDNAAMSDEDLARALGEIVLAHIPEIDRAEDVKAVNIAVLQKKSRDRADASRLTAQERALVILRAMLEKRGKTMH